jgi:hypothetical protein
VVARALHQGVQVYGDPPQRCLEYRQAPGDTVLACLCTIAAQAVPPEGDCAFWQRRWLRQCVAAGIPVTAPAQRWVGDMVRILSGQEIAVTREAVLAAMTLSCRQELPTVTQAREEDV